MIGLGAGNKLGMAVAYAGRKLSSGGASLIKSAKLNAQAVAKRVSTSQGMSARSVADRMASMTQIKPGELPPGIQSMSKIHQAMYRIGTRSGGGFGLEKVFPKSYLRGTVSYMERMRRAHVPGVAPITMENLGGLSSPDAARIIRAARTAGEDVHASMRAAGQTESIKALFEVSSRVMRGHPPTGIPGMRSNLGKMVERSGIYRDRNIAGRTMNFKYANLPEAAVIGTFRGGRAIMNAAFSGGMRGHLVRSGLFTGAAAAGAMRGAHRAMGDIHGMNPYGQRGSKSMSPKSAQMRASAGTGYVSWAKRPGRPMPSNHLSTEGLSLALHNNRRK